MTTDLLFTPNIELMEYLENTYKENTITVLNIFQHLAYLNSIYHNHDKIFLDKLEQRLMDIIADATNVDDAKMNMEIYLKRAIEAYLRKYFISLEMPQLSIFNLEDILNAIVNIYQVDIPTSEEIITTIECDDIPNIDRFTSIISSYSTLSESFLSEITSEVDDEWFSSMLGYLRAKVHRGIEEVNADDLLKLQPLLDIIPEAISSKVVIEVLYYGYKEYKLEDMLDELYKRIALLDQDFKSIAIEIFATNYLSTDRPINSIDSLKEIINFKALDKLEYKVALDHILPIYQDLLNNHLRG